MVLVQESGTLLLAGRQRKDTLELISDECIVASSCYECGIQNYK